MGAGAGHDCVLMGEEPLLEQCGEILLRRGRRIVAVVADRRSLRDWAERVGAQALPPADDLAAALAGLDYDWFFSVANLRVVPESVWRKARSGAANFHDGPLPRHAGLNAPSWAILAGETRFGVTWHAMTGEIDAGDVYAQRLFDIAADETAFTLNGRCFEAGIAAFEDLVQTIDAGGPFGRPQDLAERTLHRRWARPDAAGLLRLDQSMESLDRTRRALDFGPGYANPLALPKLLIDDVAVPVVGLERLDVAVLAAPGQLLAVDGSGVTVAVGDGAVRLSLAETDPVGRAALAGLSIGQGLQIPSDAEARQAAGALSAAARHEADVVALLSSARPLAPAYVMPAATGAIGASRAIEFAAPAVGGDRLLAALLAFLVRDSGQDTFDVAYSDAVVSARWRAHPSLFTAATPLRVAASPNTSATAFENRALNELRLARRRGGHAKDLEPRRPGLAEIPHPVGLARAAAPRPSDAVEGCAVTFVAPSHGRSVLLVFDETRVTTSDAKALARRAEVAIAAFIDRPEAPLCDLPLMSGDDERRLLAEWSRTDDAYDQTSCLHEQIERQIDRTPDAIALASGDEAITYRELEERSNAVAHALAGLGVGPDRPVGLRMKRSIDLVVGAVGIMKAGGAYVPLDPAYPAERTAFMIEDSGLDVVLTERRLDDAAANRRSLLIEDVKAGDWPRTRLKGRATPENLAYVIYTSGSTGRPKGVMVEHRNVANFFAGMDERVSRGSVERPVWLAVTSLSFDISVLELFWTLARGFKVVLAPTPGGADFLPAVQQRAPVAMDFGLFYWGTDGGAGRKKYELLLEGAKFADTHGFKAIWTPERHFHAFGDPYPNPAVTGAAVAAVTRNLAIRAGSCVLPLHHPARVAEEWAVLDNLSDGRVGLAFACGWMPEDFALRPENVPPHNKPALTRDIDLVRRLWRGEGVDFGCGDKTICVTTHPRPVQKELPIWVTTAGNPETYREAARLGANVLTHLLGQTVEELAGKIAIYRKALAEAGHDPASHKVTLMLHTLVGDDRASVKELAREPMKDYLRSAAALIKQYAWAFPAFKKPAGAAQAMDIDLRSLSPEEMDAILDYAFERYFEDSGLFGTVDDALDRVAEVRAIGVDEIACLIDFGVASETVLSHLTPLSAVVAAADGSSDRPATVESVGALIRRHGVTHMQFTPSMAVMLLQTPEDRAALGSVTHLYVGGEALTSSLVSELRAATDASIENMYGPTETTVWSSTTPASGEDAVTPLGRPIANTQLYVLDRFGRLCPPGAAGELFIGGRGVTRGYLHRPELTAERFRPDPFTPGGRMYQTGDLVRLSPEGALLYVGRVDNQVKLRGRRIELGEIEARLREAAGVTEAIVVVREDRPGDARLVAYVRSAAGPIEEAVLRERLATTLPDYMVPAHVVTLERFPLTPNAKIDRNALPRPEETRAAAPIATFVAPENEVQRQVAEAFSRLLGAQTVGLNDSFFALGGHSLLAVQAHRELKAAVAPDLAVTDLFRFPTVKALADHIVRLREGSQPNQAFQAAADRAAARRRGMSGGALLGRERGIA